MKLCRVCGKDISHRKGNIKTCEEHNGMVLDYCSICGKDFVKRVDNNRSICYECRCIPKICKICGKTYTLGKTSFYSDCCSDKCRKRDRYLESWEGGHYTGNSLDNEKSAKLIMSRKKARELIYEKLNLPKICEMCGSGEDIEIHHKDRDPFNNEPNNLQRLCNKCHIKEHVRLRKI